MLFKIVLSILIFVVLGVSHSFAQEKEGITVQKFNLPNNDVITNLSNKISDGEIDPLLGQLSTRDNNQPILFLDNSPGSKESKELEAQLKAKKLDYVRVDVQKAIDLPVDNLSKEGAEKFSGFKKWWKSKYEAPYPSDKRWGVISMTNRFVISSMVWFSVGLDPVTAGMLVAGQTASAYLNTVYERTLDNIFGIKGDVKHLPKQIGYRLLYTAFWTYLWRAISGPVKTAHSIFTPQGNFEVLSNILSTGFAGNVFGLTKGVVLSRKASMLIGFHGFLIGSIFTTLDLAGVNSHSWLVNLKMPEILSSWGTLSVEIRASTLMILGYYFAAAYAVWKVPKYFETYTNFIEGFITKLTGENPNAEANAAESEKAMSCSSVFAK